MNFKNLFRSGPAGVAAGVATLMLGGGAVAALAFSSSEPTLRPMGDSRLSVGNQAFDAALVANAGANNVAAARAVAGRDMADGSPVARVTAASRGPASAAGGAAATSQSSNSSSATAPARPGSAEYYRALLRAGSAGGGTLAMLPPGAANRISSGGRLAGDLTGANSTDFTRDQPANAVGDPLVPSRAFSSYGSNDAGSSAAASKADRKSASNRPALGTSSVGPASKPSAGSGSSASSSGMPAASTPAPTIPAVPAKRADPSSSGSSVPGMVSSAPSNTVTQPLGPGQSSLPGSVGNAVHQPAMPPTAQQPGTPGSSGSTPGTPAKPPVTSVVGPDAILTPEPGTWLMVGSGLLLLGIIGRRRASQAS